MSYLKEAYKRGNLKRKEAPYFQADSDFNSLKNVLYKKTWIGYCKQPFSGAESVLDYLGRYVYRVAISNHRLLAIENGKVVFRWRDYRDGRVKVMKLEAFEFIRRFLLHILPSGFCKVRYYGILASRNLKTKLLRAKEVLKVCLNKVTDVLPWKELYFQLTGKDINLCPLCGVGHMLSFPLSHSPP